MSLVDKMRAALKVNSGPPPLEGDMDFWHTAGYEPANIGLTDIILKAKLTVPEGYDLKGLSEAAWDAMQAHLDVQGDGGQVNEISYHDEAE